jgi:hypothetical protein
MEVRIMARSVGRGWVGRPFTFGDWDDVYVCKRLLFSLDLRCDFERMTYVFADHDRNI